MRICQAVRSPGTYTLVGGNFFFFYKFAKNTNIVLETCGLWHIDGNRFNFIVLNEFLTRNKYFW